VSDQSTDETPWTRETDPTRKIEIQLDVLRATRAETFDVMTQLAQVRNPTLDQVFMVLADLAAASIGTSMIVSDMLGDTTVTGELDSKVRDAERILEEMVAKEKAEAAGE
jgi:hypothetical protein